LAVTHGSFTAVPESLAYTWLRCNANGRVCTPIAGAGAASYVVTPDDAGHALVSQVTATSKGRKVVVLSTAALVPA
jgi:hypothetical protein